MRFMTRSLLAIVLLSVTVALLAVAVSQVRSAVNERQSREARQRPAQERVFTVNVDTIEIGSAQPVITAFGEISSWRTLELRSATSGRLVALSDVFRDGGAVSKGDLLYRIDPSEAEATRALAASRVEEAEAEISEAAAAVMLAKAELTAATEQLALRDQALLRAQDLKSRGVGTDATVETATLARSSAAQTEIARKQAMAQAEARIVRARIGLDRERISLREAERQLEETAVFAPFDGILTDVSAVQGRLIGNNEKLGSLIDPLALEVAFRVSNAQFSRLIDERGALRSVPITATLDLAGAPVVVSGMVDRAGGEVGDGQTGRIIYATLEPENAQPLRPGDFMRVEIAEPPLENVAVVPASAVSADGRILLLHNEDRLESANVDILRRQGDDVIITGVEAGRDYVLRLQPQLGAGVKVKAFHAGTGLIEVEMVELAPERRAKLVAAVEGNAYIPNDVKTRILGQLAEQQVPANVVARLEARMGGADKADNGGETVALSDERRADGGPTAPNSANEELVALDEDRRARLVAFVQNNQRMPADAKERVLDQLRSANVPKALLDRLESRMGG